MSDTIQINRTADLVEITLNRPDRLNSFNEEMHVALSQAIKHARDSQARAILLTGSGRGFCAGQDLADRDPSTMVGPADLSQTLTQFYNPLVRLIRSLRFPVVCAVNGVAAGADVNLALACDIVIAADDATFIQSFANVGLVPDSGGTWFLTQLLGEARAKALTFTAHPLSAEKAEQWGMIWKAVPGEVLLEEARDLAMQLSTGPTTGFAHTKDAIQTASRNDLDQQLDIEAQYQKLCGQSLDYAEGVSSFLKKSKPNFTGQ